MPCRGLHLKNTFPQPDVGMPALLLSTWTPTALCSGASSDGADADYLFIDHHDSSISCSLVIFPVGMVCREFKSAIAGAFFTDKQFNYQLTHGEAQRLCKMFSSSAAKRLFEACHYPCYMCSLASHSCPGQAGQVLKACNLTPCVVLHWPCSITWHRLWLMLLCSSNLLFA